MNRQRIIIATAVWTLVSSAMGFLALGLLSAGVGSHAGLAHMLWVGARRGGALVLTLSLFAAVSGAVIGDLPGLYRPQPAAYLVWREARRDRDQFAAPLREALLATVAWCLLAAGLIALWPGPQWLNVFALVFGVARALQLGRHLGLRRQYRRAEAEGWAA